LSVVVHDTALPSLSTTEKCVVWSLSGGGSRFGSILADGVACSRSMPSRCFCT
jgi:hypothetical protein